MRISPTGFKVTCARLSTANATVLGSTIPFWPFAALDEKKSERTMAKTVSVIGIEDKELRWIRSLILLLRHPDPSIPDRKSTRLNSSHLGISYAVFCLKKNITCCNCHDAIALLGGLSVGRLLRFAH